MSDPQFLFEHQAAWQKNRRHLSWPEKIRLVETLQKSLRQLRGSGNQLPRTPEDSEKPRRSQST